MIKLEQVKIEEFYDKEDVSETLLDDLNSQQREAVMHKGSPLLILAGVGTGKTETLMRKYAYLIGVRNKLPKNIMCVTFTNKAAKEMQKRAAQRLGYDEE